MPGSDARAGDGQPMRAVFDHAAIGMCLLELDGRIAESNAALSRMLGYSDGELGLLRLAELAHEDDVDEAERLYLEMVRGERDHYTVEHRFVRRDGEVVWGRLTSSMVRDPDSSATHALVVVENVTRRREVEAELASREAKFRSLIENASEVVTIAEANGTIRYESPAVERVLGWTSEELEGRDLFEFVHPEDAAVVALRFREALDHPRRKMAYGFRFRHKDGTYRWLEGIGVNLLDDPAVRGLVANSRDVTERVEAERKLAAYSRDLEHEHALFEQLFEASPAAVVLTDPNDRIIRINPEFMRLFGYTAVEAVGRTLSELIAPETAQEEAIALVTPSVEGERVEMETVRRRRDGTMLNVSVVGVPVRLRGDRIAVYSMYRDITDQKEAEAALERHATTDPLTGLLNRRGFLTVLQHASERARRAGSPLVLVVLDLDRFKAINDAHGHAEGDRALQVTADLLRGSFRASDAIGRSGGDEFVILATDAGERSEHIIRQRIRSALQRLNASGRLPYEISASVGIHRAPAEDISSMDDLLVAADHRMYEEKRGKRRE